MASHRIGILTTSNSNSSSSQTSTTTSGSYSVASSSSSKSVGGSATRSVPAILSRKRKLDQADMDLSQYFSGATASSASSSSAGILPMEDNAAIVITSSSSSSDDTSDEDDDCMVISENTQPPMQQQQQQQQQGPPRRSLSQSSRIPLSTIQTTTSRILQQQQQHQPSEHSILKQQQQQLPMPPSRVSSSPAALLPSAAPVPKRQAPAAPPSAKKLKLRQSWSQFREFIRTTSSMQLSASAEAANPLPSLDWVDRRDLWELVRKKETGMYSRRAQTTAQLFARHPAIQERMRAVLFDWLIEVCEVYRLHRETFYLATDFIDRYLAKTEEVPKTRLQLLGVTCLFVAAKIEEIYPPKLGEFTYVTDGACSDEEILQMELVVLKELNWGLSPMTPNAWVKLFMQTANTDQRAAAAGSFLAPPQYTGLPFCRVMQLIDLCILDAGSLKYSYSVLAATALGIVMGDRALAAAVSGHDWTSFSTLGECEEWMRHFHAALRQECPTLVPRTFPNITLDDAHNVQSHATDVRVLDVARERLKKAEAQLHLERQILAAQAEEAAARDRLSPDPSTLDSGAAADQLMTPPEESGDVMLAAAARSAHSAQSAALPSTPAGHADPSTVFLSPETPTTQQPASKKTLTYPMVNKQ